MQYRTLGRTGLRVSALGFGCMRFLNRRGRATWGPSIDRGAALGLLESAADLGINYFDTAYNYHGGASETLLGEFLRRRGRDGILIATKSPVWKVSRRSDLRRLLNVQRKRLGTERIDLYLLHALGGESFRKVVSLGALEFLDAEKRSGRIGAAGFSFHDRPAAFAPIVDAYDWDFCQIQYNILDTEEQAGTAGLLHAAGRGMGVVVMEPLRGGDLAGRLPDPVEEVWGIPPGSERAGLCLRWIWNHPEVSAVLSGMNTADQLVSNALAASGALPRSLPQGAIRTAERVRDALRGLHRVGCTSCGYCLPCPEGVAIPEVFGLVNEACMFPESGLPRTAYGSWMKPEQRADRCTGCGHCEGLCPQSVPVREKLREAHELLSAPTRP